MTSPTQQSDQDHIDAEAVAWYVRRLENPAGKSSVLHDATEDIAFAKWLAVDPRHQKTYDQFVQTGDDIVLAVPSSDRQSPAARSPHRQKLAARLIAATVVLAALGAGSGLYLNDRHNTKTTRTGETQLLTLDDGTRINLSARSEIKVRYTGRAREIILRQGEAFFDVGHDPKRPFSVVAAGNVIRDIGTQFNVNLRRASLQVSVVQGEVSVKPEGNALTIVKAAERVTVALPASGTATSQKPLSSTPSDTLKPAPVSVVVAPLPYQGAVALKEGRQFYDNAALGDIVEDLNRYYAPGIVLGSPDLANRRLTASLAPRDIDAFLAGLPVTAQVTIKRSGDGHVTILPQSGPSR